MLYPPAPFPQYWIIASGILALLGLCLIFLRTRRPPAAEPHCHRCDYLLTGISSDRCPECGTKVDPLKGRPGSRLARRARWAAGALLVVAGAVAMPWTRVSAWYRGVYWYHYHTTSSLIEDVKHGSGQPVPDNYPNLMWLTHGMLFEEQDLARRAALEELLERDRFGKLSAARRHELDEMELANLNVPETTPVQPYLSGDLSHRIAAGKLSTEQLDRFYRAAITIDLAVRTRVGKADATPVRIIDRTASLWGYSPRWVMNTDIHSTRLDGHETLLLSDGGLPGEIGKTAHAVNGSKGQNDFEVTCRAPGRHQLVVEIVCELCRCDDGSGYQRKAPTVFHTETRTLTANFEVVDAPAETLIQTINDPNAGDALKRGFAPSQGWLVDGADSYVFLDLQPTPVSYAFDVFARVDGAERLLDHITRAANAPRSTFDINLGLQDVPVPSRPRAVDLIFRSDPNLPSQTVDIYSIWTGEFEMKNVPVTSPMMLRAKGPNPVTPAPLQYRIGNP